MVALVNQAPTKVSVVELTASLLSFIKFIFERFQGFPDSSVGKEYTCNAGEPGSVPWSRRSAGEGIGYALLYSWASLMAGKDSACNVGDLGSIPGLGRSPREGNGKPLQYSCLKNPVDRGAWQATVHEVTRVGHDLATKPPPI